MMHIFSFYICNTNANCLFYVQGIKKQHVRNCGDKLSDSSGNESNGKHVQTFYRLWFQISCILMQKSLICNKTDKNGSTFSYMRTILLQLNNKLRILCNMGDFPLTIY
jgi:hypothetical protein